MTEVESSPGTIPPIETEADLEERLSRPTPDLVRDLSGLEGDLIVLGVGGKMGPTLARMAVRASAEAGTSRRVIGVSRFTHSAHRTSLEEAGVSTFACDLLDREAVQRLPDAPNVVFMAGMKFGSTGAEALTWAVNAVMPAQVAERYRDSRIAVFSSGNVYPFMPLAHGGATEGILPCPLGEYAQSVLARERIFEYTSQRHGTRCVLLRLNYAIDLRYGVLLDLARKVVEDKTIDLTTGSVNVLWQGDANAMALRSLARAQTPPLVLNLTGPETLSVRWLAHRLGELLGQSPRYEGGEAPTALLSNASRAHGLFGYPTLTVDAMLQWVAHWVKIGGATLDKPTHFEVRDGRF